MILIERKEYIMKSTEQAQLYEVKGKLNTSINKLTNVKNGLDNNFQNIGATICASKIFDIITTIENVKKKLDNLDMNSYTPEYLNAHPEINQNNIKN